MNISPESARWEIDPRSEMERRGEEDCTACGNPKAARSCVVCAREMKRLETKQEVATSHREPLQTTQSSKEQPQASGPIPGSKEWRDELRKRLDKMAS
jgi:hypothetical protein